MPQIKTRSGFRKEEPYPLNQFPSNIIESLSRHIVSLLATGNADMTGDMFGRMFADSIEGQALEAPLGIVDAAWKNCGWSVKTVKNSHPHEFTVSGGRPKNLRLISGRNRPAFSAGISDPLANVQATGNSIIKIYNSRIEQAREEYSDLRLLVFVRNMDTLKFTIFERPIVPFAVNDYQWKVNRQKNLEAYKDEEHAFTWQPHGSQFTIKEPIPESATKFWITHRPRTIHMRHVLNLVRFESGWVKHVD